MYATPKQVDFIERLLAERVLITGDADLVAQAEANLRERIAVHRSGASPMPQRFARTTIDYLLGQPRRPVSRPTATRADDGEPLAAGVYGKNGEVFLVKPSKAGNLYAKRLVPISGERLNRLGETAKFEFDYAPGVVKRLSLRDRLPLAEAEKLMIEYGRCICCNRRLKDATSVRAGIGPVCRKQFS